MYLKVGKKQQKKLRRKGGQRPDEGQVKFPKYGDGSMTVLKQESVYLYESPLIPGTRLWN